MPIRLDAPGESIMFDVSYALSSGLLETYGRDSWRDFWSYSEFPVDLKTSRFNLNVPEGVSAELITLKDIERPGDQVRLVGIGAGESVIIWTDQRVIRVWAGDDGDTISTLPRQRTPIESARFPKIQLHGDNDILNLGVFFRELRHVVDRRGLGEVEIIAQSKEEYDRKLGDNDDDSPLVFYMAIHGTVTHEDPNRGDLEACFNFHEDGTVSVWNDDGDYWPHGGVVIGEPVGPPENWPTIPKVTWEQMADLIVKFFADQVPVGASA